MPGAATFKDYTFDGWYTGEIEGELVTTDTVFSDDSVIFAHWSFALSESELTLKIGHLTETLTAITEETVTWSSGTASVATVGASTGLVTAVKNGTSVITATTADGVKGTCTVTVPNEYYIVGDLTATDLPYWSIGITNAKADCTFTQENATTYKLEGVTLKKYDTFKISFTSNGSSWDNIIDGAAVDTASKNAKYASGSSGSNISVDDSGIYTLTLTISGSSKSLNFNKTQDIEEDEEDDAVYYLRGNMVSDSWPGASTPEEAGDYAFTKVNENKYTLTVYLVKDNEFKICVVGKDWKIEFDEDCVNRDYIVSKGQSTATKPLQWTSSKNIGAGMTGWYTFTFNPNGGSKNMLSCTFSTTNPNA
ncbi:MAG: Ig-like domain-containing protein [Clostridiales bacterium]|nr:Ig-like domain-containing protein [Clostridiales bacterium]